MPLWHPRTFPKPSSSPHRELRHSLNVESVFCRASFVRQRKRRWFSMHGMAVFFLSPCCNPESKNFTILIRKLWNYSLSSLRRPPRWLRFGKSMEVLWLMAFQIFPLQNPTRFISEKPFARLLRERREELMEMLPSVKA